MSYVSYKVVTHINLAMISVILLKELKNIENYSNCVVYAEHSPSRDASIKLSPVFFSSRRRHTRLQGDWSSDVCSSDLHLRRPDDLAGGRPARRPDRGMRAPRGRGGRRGGDPAGPAGAADRGEHVAGDPLRPRRHAARPRGPADRALSGRGGARPPEGVDGHRRRAARAQRRAAPAPHDRLRGLAGRGVRRGRCGDPRDLPPGGGTRPMSQPPNEPQLTEEQLRQIEAEMERITVDDVLLQTLVTLL